MELKTMKNFSIYSKLFANYDMKKKDSHDIISRIVSHFEKNLKSSGYFLNEHTGFMTESNMCITLEFSIKTENDVNISDIENVFKSLYVETFERFSFDNSKNVLFVRRDAIYDLKDKVFSPILTMENFNNKIHTIKLNSKFAKQNNEPYKIYIELFDENENELLLNDSWINDYQLAFTEFFQNHSLTKVTLGMLTEILIGTEPKNDISSLLNKSLFITTAMMGRYDFFEKNKIWQNCRLTVLF
jgi:hypothetical protein